jgi:hypothetical protein
MSNAARAQQGDRCATKGGRFRTGCTRTGFAAGRALLEMSSKSTLRSGSKSSYGFAAERPVLQTACFPI